MPPAQNLTPPTASPIGRGRRWLRRILWGTGIIALAALVVAAWVWWYFHPPITHETGITYGQRHGKPLTFDVLRPMAKTSNGRGILFMVSGSWKSNPKSIDPVMVAALLRRGYTVFAVCHVSQPEATVMETVQDIQRAVRYIRHRADEWKVDPDHLGISGASSGGHLSLMMATRGGPGDLEAADPIERESSEIQAAAVFFPVTDLLNLGDSTENPGDGGPPIHFVKAFGPDSTNMPAWKITGRDMSPIYHTAPDLPPVFIIHGDADTLVPVDQSTRFVEAAQKSGATVELVIRRGKNHGWITMLWELRQFADWFDRWLF